MSTKTKETKKEVVKIDLYADLDKTLLKNLKNKYNSIQKNMLEIAKISVQLSGKNEEQFILYCKNELNMSNGTISKFITAGKICIEGEKKNIALPPSYGAVYELNKVSAELPEFAEYYADNNNGDTLDKASYRSILSNVKSYLKDGEDSTEEKEEEEETTGEETTEEVEDITEEEETEIVNEGISELLTLLENNLLELIDNPSSELAQDGFAILNALKEVIN